jgi:hypothetical protein
MEIILDIGAVLVFAMVLISVTRAVWLRNPGPHAGILAGFVAAFLVIFGLVSMSVASGISENSSSTSQAVLLIGIIVVAILCGVTWSSAPPAVRS